MFRIKTKEEFIQENLWDFSRQAPFNWHVFMNKYLGQLINENVNVLCVAKRHFNTDDRLNDRVWGFRYSDYTLLEKKYKNDILTYLNDGICKI